MTAQDTKEKVMAAAIKVFGQKGFHGATTREIAREAGVAEGTIFRHFKSKKDLLVSLATPMVVDSLIGLIDEVSNRSDEEIIKAVINNRIKIIREHMGIVKLLIYESVFHPEVQEILYSNIISKAKGVLEKFISQRIQQGRFKDVDPSHAARCLAGMVFMMILWENVGLDESKGLTKDEKITQLVDIFLHGMTKS
ncbi:MAG: TetR/AcrR family transcriptional regulator [Clostridia bacterium]|nr:TetR/AcrR family transcriptional regulator [Clostridia bacterium]